MGLFSTKNHFPVDGRTVLVTGASQGMGRSVARLLAQKGANVVIVARNVQRLEEALEHTLAGAIHESQRFHFISADLTSSAEATRVLTESTAWNNNSPPDIGPPRHQPQPCLIPVTLYSPPPPSPFTPSSATAPTPQPNPPCVPSSTPYPKSASSTLQPPAAQP
ncbi:MAG: hypothetical protein Q9206_002647 [Seirophora lacunosa]